MRSFSSLIPLRSHVRLAVGSPRVGQVVGVRFGPGDSPRYRVSWDGDWEYQHECELTPLASSADPGQRWEFAARFGPGDTAFPVNADERRPLLVLFVDIEADGLVSYFVVEPDGTGRSYLDIEVAAEFVPDYARDEA